MNGVASGDEVRAMLVAAAALVAPAPLADLMLSLVRPSVALSPARAAAEASPRCGSYGGLPHLPEGVPWPSFAGTPMVLLADLDCAVLAGLLPPEEWRLPADGRLLFFHEDGFAASGQTWAGGLDVGCRVLHVDGAASGRAASSGRAAWPGARAIEAIPLAATAALSVPDSAERVLDAAMRTQTLALIDLVADLKALLPPATHRVLGWCDSDIPGSARPPGYRPLLQLGAEMGTAWGEVVSVGFWLPSADLAAGRLDRAVRVIEVA